MIRALVVDDSVVVRRLLNDVLTSDPRISVVGSAPTGEIALQKLGHLNPDVVVLDVEMPGMDGIETVRQLRKGHPKLPVIMCSALTERGAEVTLRALAAGATDYVTKPSTVGLQNGGLDVFKQQLLSRVLAFAAPFSLPPAPPTIVPRTVSALPVRDGAAAIAAIAIGCSTGGPNALRELFSRIPSDLPVPLFIVQHMPKLFTKTLADSLTASSGVNVREATHRELVEPGAAYVAPGDFHMTLGRDGARTVILLNQDPPENSCRPAVDVLFRSVAQFYGRSLLACVLTGMGRDGTLGAERIVATGGRVLVQCPDTCVVPSMPSAVLAAGWAEATLPLAALGDVLVQRARRAATQLPRLSLSSGG